MLITKGVGGHVKKIGKNAFPVNLTPLSRNNFVLWVEPLYIIYQGGGGCKVGDTVELASAVKLTKKSFFSFTISPPSFIWNVAKMRSSTFPVMCLGYLISDKIWCLHQEPGPQWPQW